jgi:hypothetical protein
MIEMFNIIFQESIVFDDDYVFGKQVFGILMSTKLYIVMFLRCL